MPRRASHRLACRRLALHLHLFTCLVPLGALFAEEGPATSSASSAPLAWMRFDDASQSYTGRPYRWLADGSFELEIDVAPARGHVLELLWGSKDDVRDGVATINGRAVKLEQGGYDGFRWLRVPVPEGVAGESYSITITQGHQKAGFVAEVRLAAAGEAAKGDVDMKSRSHRVTFRLSRPVKPDAFPSMREMWDREPARPPLPADPAARRIEEQFRLAERNGRLAAEMLYRCRRFVDGWLAHADPATGLIPRNLTQGRTIWNAQDSAADNYPFMVLTCALTDRDLFEGRMLDMLRTETRLTSRIDRLPDTWSFTRQAFEKDEPDLGSIIFGGSEYVKDGLLPLTEWLGPSPWSERMFGIVDDIWKHAPVETPHGRIPSTNVEVNGEMLQVLSRIYWMSGREEYLEYAIRLGDYYLLGKNHPARDLDVLRLRDHGCEIASGLCELYAAVRFAAPEKKKAYEEPIHLLCDRILELGRNEHGMLYNSFGPKTGEHAAGICDTWGYNYNGIYTVFLVDGDAEYRDAVRKVLSNLKEHYVDHHWGSADEYADSIEGAINLYNREPVAPAAEWIDSEIHDMWSVQRPDGVLEGWHGDGNSARTAIMYALWKTQGLTLRPWRADARVGAVRDGDALLVSLRSDSDWSGVLLFDGPRHEEVFRLPIDYPRINQFPEWFVARRDRRYAIRAEGGGAPETASGEKLREGWPIRLEAGQELRLVISPAAQP